MGGIAGDRVAIIGAGVGGLAAAIELATAGVEVDLFERADEAGGKLHVHDSGGRLIDAGPTVLTLPDVFDGLFRRAGTNLAAELQLTPLPLLARHWWPGGASLDLWADRDRSEAAIGEFAGGTAAQGFAAFMRRAADVFDLLEPIFIRADRPSPPELVRRAGLKQLGQLWSIAPFTTLWDLLGTYFPDHRLHQLFGRYATYCGASPFSAPATLMLVAHVEQLGVWQVQGGMKNLARALRRAAERQGVRFHFGTPVQDIIVRAGRAAGLRLANGKPHEAGSVMFNGDVGALAAGHLGGAARRATAAVAPRDRSLSAVTWTMQADAGGFPLDHHNVFFSDDYAAEFQSLASGNVPWQPTVYVCAQDRGPDREPPRMERLLALVNAPPTGDICTEEMFAPCKQAMQDQLARCGLQLMEQPTGTTETTPLDFARSYPATGGALYGRAPKGWRASFQRPGARSRLPGLYLGGGSTHPGPGLPMAALSGRQAAQTILKDLGSRGR